MRTDEGSPKCARPLWSAIGFLEEFWSESDLLTFWQQLGPENVPPPTVTVTGSAADEGEEDGTIEASLDIQYLTSLTGSGVKTAFWSFAGRAADNAEDEPFLAWLLQLASTPDDQVCHAWFCMVPRPYVFTVPAPIHLFGGVAGPGALLNFIW